MHKKKIKIYLNGDSFNMQEMKKIVSVEKEYRIYETVDKILNNKAAEVIDYLEKTKEYMGVLYSLYGELEVMYKLSCLRSSGMKFSSNYAAFKNEFEGIKEIFKTNNRLPNPYVIFMKFPKLKNYTAKNLRRLVFRCWEVEKDIKTGKIEMESGIETLIMETADLYVKK